MDQIETRELAFVAIPIRLDHIREYFERWICSTEIKYSGINIACVYFLGMIPNLPYIYLVTIFSRFQQLYHKLLCTLQVHMDKTCPQHPTTTGWDASSASDLNSEDFGGRDIRGKQSLSGLWGSTELSYSFAPRIVKVRTGAMEMGVTCLPMWGSGNEEKPVQRILYMHILPVTEREHARERSTQREKENKQWIGDRERTREN